MIAKYLIQLRQSKLCRKGCCQPPYNVTPLETAMSLGVKGRRSYPLLRLGSYKPMVFWPWVIDRLSSLQKNPFHPACFCPQKNTFRTWNTTSESVLFSEYQVLDTRLHDTCRSTPHCDYFYIPRIYYTTQRHLTQSSEVLLRGNNVWLISPCLKAGVLRHA